jgi:hypothetical protein
MARACFQCPFSISRSGIVSCASAEVAIRKKIARTLQLRSEAFQEREEAVNSSPGQR